MTVVILTVLNCFLQSLIKCIRRSHFSYSQGNRKLTEGAAISGAMPLSMCNVLIDYPFLCVFFFFHPEVVIGFPSWDLVSHAWQARAVALRRASDTCLVPWWRCSGGCCWPKRVSGSPLLLPFHVSTSSQPLRPASALWHVTEIQLHQPIFNHLLYVCLAFFLRLKAGHQKLLASRGVMYQGMCGVTLKTRRRLFINCSLLSCPGRLLRTHMSLSVLQLFVQEFERGKKALPRLSLYCWSRGSGEAREACKHGCCC